MKKFLRRLDLLLCQLLLISFSVLWFPITAEDGVKVHHIVIVALSIVAAISGSIFAFLHASLRETPVLHFALILWTLTLIITTTVFDTAWTPIKVTAFLAQILVGNYAAYRLVSARGVQGLKAPLNISIAIFLVTFFGLSGVPLGNIVEMFLRSITTANPNIIIFELLARAPLFQSFSEDGLDGLRHTISVYLVLVLLVNACGLRSRLDVVLCFMLLFLILLLQSRSAWLSLIGPAVAIGIAQMWRMSAGQWLLTIMVGPVATAVAAITLGPILWTRLSQTQSYDARTDRLDEAVAYLGQYSLKPITMFREFSSPHMFIFDSYYSGGIFAFFVACIVATCVGAKCLPRGKIIFHPAHLAFVFAAPLFVRLFTAGSGLPGVGATFAFSVALALSAHLRAAPTR